MLIMSLAANMHALRARALNRFVSMAPIKISAHFKRQRASHLQVVTMRGMHISRASSVSLFGGLCISMRICAPSSSGWCASFSTSSVVDRHLQTHQTISKKLDREMKASINMEPVLGNLKALMDVNLNNFHLYSHKYPGWFNGCVGEPSNEVDDLAIALPAISFKPASQWDSAELQVLCGEHEWNWRQISINSMKDVQEHFFKPNGDELRDASAICEAFIKFFKDELKLNELFKTDSDWRRARCFSTRCADFKASAQSPLLMPPVLFDSVTQSLLGCLERPHEESATHDFFRYFTLMMKHSQLLALHDQKKAAFTTQGKHEMTCVFDMAMSQRLTLGLLPAPLTTLICHINHVEKRHEGFLPSLHQTVAQILCQSLIAMTANNKTFNTLRRNTNLSDLREAQEAIRSLDADNPDTHSALEKLLSPYCHQIDKKTKKRRNTRVQTATPSPPSAVGNPHVNIKVSERLSFADDAQRELILRIIDNIHQFEVEAAENLQREVANCKLKD